MRLFLIRHPRPLLASGICYGQFDVAAEDPLPHAMRLRSLLPAGIPVLASPLQRARRLAALLHPQPRFDRRVMEISFGAWEGVPWASIDRHLLDVWATDVAQFAPPGGESLATLQARVIDCISGVRDEDLALVAHAGVIRVILGHYLRMPFDRWIQLPLDFAGLSLLEVTPAGDRRLDDGFDQACLGVAASVSARLHYLNR
ncbi:MAG TPA: histidine phosphatase family protein [Accumulibacter sp.]|nr:histidine phosphatase family protein [Accumulibacter sp.]HQC79363.1 histidine phosphatase family protein [Accumulibacter sp.]